MERILVMQAKTANEDSELDENRYMDVADEHFASDYTHSEKHEYDDEARRTDRPIKSARDVVGRRRRLRVTRGTSATSQPPLNWVAREFRTRITGSVLAERAVRAQTGSGGWAFVLAFARALEAKCAAVARARVWFYAAGSALLAEKAGVGEMRTREAPGAAPSYARCFLGARTTFAICRGAARGQSHALSEVFRLGCDVASQADGGAFAYLDVRREAKVEATLGGKATSGIVIVVLAWGNPWPPTAGPMRTYTPEGKLVVHAVTPGHVLVNKVAQWQCAAAAWLLPSLSCARRSSAGCYTQTSAQAVLFQMSHYHWLHAQPPAATTWFSDLSGLENRSTAPFTRGAWATRGRDGAYSTMEKQDTIISTGTIKNLADTSGTYGSARRFLPGGRDPRVRMRLKPPNALPDLLWTSTTVAPSTPNGTRSSGEGHRVADI
ncbi:hypothetical protein K438DRAFT_1753751 [Mycena galopus ATCC 62051]|nr:hypothetical protein K438DRAFT_1753751 [Mycena galopus ATCC 62051]